MAEPWRPTSQGDCPCPGCNRAPVTAPAYTPVQRVASDRQPVPHEDGGVTYRASETDPRAVQQWIEDTDPDPAPLPPVPEDHYPPGAVDLPAEYARPPIFRRIFNATKRK